MDILINDFKNLLRAMSYYNAAEGNWQSEKQSRDNTREKLQNKTKELLAAGLKESDIATIVRSGQYLVDDEWRIKVEQPTVKNKLKKD